MDTHTQSILRNTACLLQYGRVSALLFPAMRIIAIANQKGGVGKTSDTINLGGALAEAGRRVLLVDLDPQGHLTDAVGAKHATTDANLANALLGRWAGNLGELVQQVGE